MAVDPITGKPARERVEQPPPPRPVLNRPQPPENKTEFHAPEKLEQPKEEPVIEYVDNHKIIVTVKAGMIAVGTGASIVSIYYTAIWFMSILNPFLSILLSSIMVVYSVLSFEVMVYILTQPKSFRMMTVFCVFSFLWVVVVAFSITSTVAGQYNSGIEARRKLQLTDAEIKEQRTLNLLKEERTEIKKEIEEKTEERNMLISKLSEIEGVDEYEKRQTTHTTLSRKLDIVNGRLYRLRANLKTTTAKLENAGAEKEEVKDFYSWLSEIFNTDRSLIQFIISIFPAVFVDIIAPTAFATVFFNDSKRR